MKRELSWLCETPTQILSQALWDLDKSLRDYYSRVNTSDAGRVPRFKKKGASESFRISYGIVINPAFSKQVGSIQLPGLGDVKYRRPRKIDGTLLYAVIKKRAGLWHLSLCCQVVPSQPSVKTHGAVGIDRGIVSFATFSDGAKEVGPQPAGRFAMRLRRLQRSLGRKEKFSGNWKKIKQKIGRVHLRTTDIRSDFLQKLSTRIVKNHAIIVMEKLDIKRMSRSASGTLERPGKGVRSKSRLNRAIHDQGWHRFQRMIEYKGNLRGGELRLVCARYTSQTCSNCGDCTDGNRPNQSDFRCGECGFVGDADINAAMNILAAGHVVNACGGMPDRAPAKQETPISHQKRF